MADSPVIVTRHELQLNTGSVTASDKAVKYFLI